MATPHFLFVTFPAQGHINPSLQFSKCIIRLGARVTFVTSVSAHRQMVDSQNKNVIEGLSFAPFSDGHDDGLKPGTDLDLYMAELQRRGAQAVRDLIVASLNRGEKFSCVFYTVLLPWVADVASCLHVPSTLVWIQSANIFAIYYYYVNGYEEMLENAINNPSSEVQLPGLPLLRSRDIPPFDGASFVLPLLKHHFKVLEDNPIVLVNTFDALELTALRVVSKVKLSGIGPLIPSAFLDRQDPLDTSFGGDLFRSSKDYIEWLNAKPIGSVIYISFGSLFALSGQQKEEMARGLLGCGRPFLWVMRNAGWGSDGQDQFEVSKEELEKLGIIVPWCSQLEVLTHPSVGCFVTHCGWNSTLESLVCQVPVVAFPQRISDQITNAKLIEDMWMTGVRVNPNGEGIVEAKEIGRCLELLLGNGEKGKELKDNAQKWRDLAMEASMDSGSSHNNLRAFMDEIISKSI